MSAALAMQVVASTYAVACDLTIPVAGDEARELGAVASIDDDGGVVIFVDGTDVTCWPSDMPVYLKEYEVHIPSPGPTQLAIDDDLRTALEHAGWVVR